MAPLVCLFWLVAHALYLLMLCLIWFWGWRYFDSLPLGLFAGGVAALPIMFFYWLGFQIGGGRETPTLGIFIATIPVFFLSWGMIFGDISPHYDLKKSYKIAMATKEDAWIMQKLGLKADAPPHEIYRRLRGEVVKGDWSLKEWNAAEEWAVHHNGLPPFVVAWRDETKVYDEKLAASHAEFAKLSAKMQAETHAEAQAYEKELAAKPKDRSHEPVGGSIKLKDGTVIPTFDFGPRVAPAAGAGTPAQDP
jgi:hypothetical protein